MSDRNIVFVCLDVLSKTISSLHISLSFSSFSFICFNILYSDESGNGVLTWRLNPGWVHYGKTAQSADRGARYNSDNKEHNTATWLYSPTGLSFLLATYHLWEAVFITMCVQEFVCVCVFLSEPGESPDYTIRRVMVSSTVLPPFPNTAKSLPADQILSDKSRQLSLHFIHTDMQAPRWGRLGQRRRWQPYLKALGIFVAESGLSDLLWCLFTNASATTTDSITFISTAFEVGVHQHQPVANT